MKFKTFVINTQHATNETDEIIAESFDELLKIKNITSALDYDLLKNTVSNVSKLLKTKVIKTVKIETLKKQAKELCVSIDVLSKKFIMLKSEMKTNYFDNIIKLLYKLIESINFHVEKEQTTYDSLNR